MPTRTAILLIYLILTACKKQSSESLHSEYSEDETFISISRASYKDQLYGFWLGQSIANWTGLVTEMDKIGNIGDTKTGDFYTSKDWNQPDLPSI